MTPRPLVVAHRGASAIAPGNTLESFEKAIELRADMIEFDVRSTSDGVLVAHHDPVSEWTYGELCRVLPYEPPRLAEVVELCTDRIELDVELKEPGVEDEVLAIVSAKFAPHEFVVTSFLDDVVAAVKRLRPDVRAGRLFGEDTPLNPLAVWSGDFVAPHFTLVDRGVFPEERGLFVWTVNDEPRLRRYLAVARIAAVITDDPALAISVRGPAGAAAERNSQ